MPTKFLQEGDWVVVKSLGERGVVAKVYGEEVRVRIPRNDDWPYPDYIQTAKSDVRKTRAPSVQSHNPIDDLEPALM